MSKNSIKVFAPATVSNVGPGYDILGFALQTPGDEVILKLTNSKGIKINKITGVKKKLPFNIYKNTATVALASLMNKYEIKEGIEVTINKKIGVGSGLGSSAASSVASVYALNHLLNLKLKKKQLLLHALVGEKISSGSMHADNVAPSLFGGFILIRSYNFSGFSAVTTMSSANPKHNINISLMFAPSPESYNSVSKSLI